MMTRDDDTVTRTPVPDPQSQLYTCFNMCCNVCVSVCVLQCVLICVLFLKRQLFSCVESLVCCSVSQCVAVCCSVLQYVAECCSVLQCSTLVLHSQSSSELGLENISLGDDNDNVLHIQGGEDPKDALSF